MRKKKRQAKRLFPKEYSASYVRTQRIDPNLAAAYNAQRSKATVGGRGDVLPKLNNSFMFEIPNTFSLSSLDTDLIDGKTGMPGKMVRSERGHVVDRKHQILAIQEHGLVKAYEVWMGARHQGVREFLTHTLEKREGYEFKMLFYGQEFMFIQESQSFNVRMISMVYRGDRNQALVRYNKEGLGWISWIKEEKLT